MADAHDKKDAHAGDAHADGGHKKHKKHHPHMPHEHEHEEGWIVSFADNVLLMMGFFVILLAMNMGPKGKSDAEEGSAGSSESLIDFAIAVREAFNNPVSLESTRPEDQPLIRRLRQRLNQGDVRTPGPDGNDGPSQIVRRGEQVGEDGYVQFEDTRSELSDSARRTIQQIAQRVVGSRWMIEVRGHTSRFETWGDVRKSRDLSYARAYAVANELVTHGILWDQIRLTACGHSNPVVLRAGTAKEAESNQRAEIMILGESLPPDPYSAAPIHSSRTPPASSPRITEAPDQPKAAHASPDRGE